MTWVARSQKAAWSSSEEGETPTLWGFQSRTLCLKEVLLSIMQACLLAGCSSCMKDCPFLQQLCNQSVFARWSQCFTDIGTRFSLRRISSHLTLWKASKTPLKGIIQSWGVGHFLYDCMSMERQPMQPLIIARAGENAWKVDERNKLGFGGWSVLCCLCLVQAVVPRSLSNCCSGRLGLSCPWRGFCNCWLCGYG